MVTMSNAHQFRFTLRAPRGAETRADHAFGWGGALFLDIVNFVNFALGRPLPSLDLRAA
jgi:hypothetical protein